MRIWSFHPSYLDAKGLVALWRETLLARHVLAGLTKGYTNHPQLNRFKSAKDPLAAIDLYLETVYKEAESRGYQFNADKFQKRKKRISIPVTDGQMAYEREHLLKKLKLRDPEKYREVKKINNWNVHPLFQVVNGPVEDWEVL